MTAAEIIVLLDLEPHPEGGWFAETFRDRKADGAGRAHSTAIYFLLEKGVTSHWHRVDAAEAWHHYAGAPLELAIAEEGSIRRLMLGGDIKAGQRPQGIVPPHAWQSAKSLGDWTLVGCTVAPGFDFAHFEIAPPGWKPL